MAGSKYRALSPVKVLQSFAHPNHGVAATRDLLGFHLREGNIRARARFIVESREQKLRTAWKLADSEAEALPDETKRFQEIPTALWWKSVDWMRDVADWNFSRSEFVITTQAKPVRRLLLDGVRFHSDDCRRHLHPGALGEPENYTKPLRDKDKWRDFWHQVIVLIQDGRTDFGAFATSKYKSDAAAADEIFTLLTPGDDPELKALAHRMSGRAIGTMSPDAILEEVRHLRARLESHA